MQLLTNKLNNEFLSISKNLKAITIL